MSSKFKIIIAMLIYGSLGVFVKKVNLQPIEIAFLRAFIGSLFLVTYGFFMKKKYSIKSLRKNILLLVVSGAALGINWALLFKSFEYTSVSNSILVYYFAPVFVILLSPIVLKESLNMSKIFCVILAVIGIFFIMNGDFNILYESKNHLKGIFYSLSAALFYSSVILMNKKIKNLSDFETTVIQLTSSAVTLLPIVFFSTSTHLSIPTPTTLIFILILGVFHTGLAYLLYFSSMQELDGQSIAIFCYIDPISAMIFATIFLGETMTLYQIIGGILVLCSTLFNCKRN